MIYYGDYTCSVTLFDVDGVKSARSSSSIYCHLCSGFNFLLFVLSAFVVT